MGIQIKSKHKKLILLVLVLFFSYQNCSHSEFPGSPLQKTDLSSHSLSDMQVQQLKFFIQQESEMQKGSYKFMVKTTNSYSLDPESGVLAEHNEASDSLSTYCLSSELLTQVRNIISSSSVCQAGSVPEEGTVCAQVIENPYAELITPSEVIRLGYATDACGANRVDLCENQSTALKNWISTVHDQLPQLQCGY